VYSSCKSFIDRFTTPLLGNISFTWNTTSELFTLPLTRFKASCNVMFVYPLKFETVITELPIFFIAIIFL
jgi:hypothetical protein